jgi:hypothetical protein
MNRDLKTLLPLALSMTVGCGALSPGGSGDDCGGKCDQANGHSLRATNQSGLALFQGINTLYDQNSAPCVEPQSQSSSAAITVGDLQEEYELYYVKSKSDLSKSINVDFGLSATLFKIVNGNAAFTLLKNFQTSSTSVDFLVSAKQNYSVTNDRPVKLSDGLPDPKADTDGFLHRCQNYYVNGLQFEADLFVLISFQAQDEQTSDMIKAQLGVTSSIPGGAILGNIDGHLSGALVNAAGMSGVSTHVVAVSRGFLLSSGGGSGAVPLGDTLSADTFSKIDSLRMTMAQSVLNDQCRDTGDTGAMCNGVPAPGYEHNQQRSATPVGVLLGSYQRATNAKFYPTDNPFQAMDDKLAGAEKYIRGLTGAQIQMENIYDTEIAPFFNAPAALQASYNLAPPQAPAANVSDLQFALSPWQAAFTPDDGAGNVGSALQAVHDAVVACWEHGSDTDFSPCHLDADPKLSPEYVTAQLQIANYAGGGRVLPLHYAIAGNTVTAGNANSKCAGMTLDGGSLQVPNLDSGNALGIFLGSAHLPAPSDSSYTHAMWINDPPCDRAALQWQNGYVGETCGVGGNVTLPVVCVPAAGAFGVIPDPGSVP